MKRPLNESFRPFSIPYDAKYIDTIEIGSDITSGTGVEVYIWGGQTECEKIFFTRYFLLLTVSMVVGGFYSGSWTTKDCIPINDNFYSINFSAETLYVVDSLSPWQ